MCLQTLKSKAKLWHHLGKLSDKECLRKCREERKRKREQVETAQHPASPHKTQRTKTMPKVAEVLAEGDEDDEGGDDDDFVPSEQDYDMETALKESTALMQKVMEKQV